MELTRTLREIAVEVQSDWSVINNAGTRDALECMRKMGAIAKKFGANKPAWLLFVGAFLGNLIGWRGPAASTPPVGALYFYEKQTCRSQDLFLSRRIRKN